MGDMETMVATLISSPQAYKLKTFTFNGKTFNSGSFYFIKELINGGFIKVVYEEKRGSVAAYDTGNNTLYLGFPKCFDLGQEAIVIHEITHAIFDMVKMKMSVADSESIAYIVQCMYARMNNTNPDIRLTGSTKARDKVFETGWNLAGKIIGGNSLTLDDCNAMREAVSQHPLYMADASHDAKMNG